MTNQNGQAPAEAPTSTDDAQIVISYGLRVFAKSPEGFVVEVVADETDRPLEWLAKTTRGLKAQKFEPVDPFPAITIAATPARPSSEDRPDNRTNRPQGGQGGGQRPQGRPAGQQGGGRPQGRQGGGGAYHGPIYDVCPWDGADVYDNREKKAGGWKGPWFGCRNGRQCGWAIWKTDGSYDE